jgi:hypothetical protein
MPPAPTAKCVFRSLIVVIAPLDDNASTTRLTMPHWSRRVANAVNTRNAAGATSAVARDLAALRASGS